MGFLIIIVILVLAIITVLFGDYELGQNNSPISSLLALFIGMFAVIFMIVSLEIVDSIDDKVADAIATQGGLTKLEANALEDANAPKLVDNGKRAIFVVCNEKTHEVALTVVQNNKKDIPERYLYMIKGATCGVADAVGVAK